MHVPILIFVLCLVTFFFTLYLISLDDLVFLRKNVSLEKLFNIAFLTLFVGGFFSRLFYVILHFNSQFFNPFVFFLLPYSPGFSLVGGFLGGLTFFAFYGRKKDLPYERMLDFFAVSFLCAVPFGFLVLILFEHSSFFFYYLLLLVSYVIIDVFVLFLFLPKMRRGELREGSICLISAILFFTLNIALEIFRPGGHEKIYFMFGKESLLSMSLDIASIIILVRYEKIFDLIKRR